MLAPEGEFSIIKKNLFPKSGHGGRPRVRGFGAKSSSRATETVAILLTSSTWV